MVARPSRSSPTTTKPVWSRICVTRHPLDPHDLRRCFHITFGSRTFALNVLRPRKPSNGASPPATPRRHSAYEEQKPVKRDVTIPGEVMSSCLDATHSFSTDFSFMGCDARVHDTVSVRVGYIRAESMQNVSKDLDQACTDGRPSIRHSAELQAIACGSLGCMSTPHIAPDYGPWDECHFAFFNP